MEEFSNGPSETRLSRVLKISKIADQLLQTLLRVAMLLGAICLIAALWPLMSSIQQIVQVLKQAINFLTRIGTDLFSSLGNLTSTLEELYETCRNIVPTIAQALNKLPGEVVEGVKKAISS
jgi:predicted PurR-regulated permease PerM